MGPSACGLARSQRGSHGGTRRWTVILSPLLLALSVVTCSGQVAAHHAQRGPAKEHLVEEQLRAIAADAVPDFQRATQAMDEARYAEAVTLLNGVLRRAPQFTPTLRRLGWSLVHIGAREQGLRFLQQAVSLERSPENLASLASELAFPTRGSASDTEKAAALALAEEASNRYRRPDDSSYFVLAASIAQSSNNVHDFREIVEALALHYPHEMMTHYFTAIVASVDEEWTRAEDEIHQAEAMGLPHEAVQELLDSGVHQHVLIRRGVLVLVALFAAWLVGLVFLFAAGKTLSGVTLRSIERADPNESITPAEHVLRRTYRALIRVAGVYYYISLPFVAVIVAGAAAGAVYALWMGGVVPVKLVVMLVLGAGLTIGKLVQSLATKVQGTEPGRPLTEDEAPGLWQLTRQVAEAVSTDPIDEIRVTPGTDMAVYERKAGNDDANTNRPRVLILGVGLLNGFTQHAFRAVLAHEYGHFSHRDTAGGEIALRVRQDMMKFAVSMVRHGQAVPWNLAFQFLRVYSFIFRRIAAGAVRLQEVLADRTAARLFGADAFEEGLRHVIRRTVEFGSLVNGEIQLVVRSRAPLRNPYRNAIAISELVHASVEKDVLAELNRQTSEDDSHPGPLDRFLLVSRVVSPAMPRGDGMVWDLIAAPERLSADMTAMIETEVRSRLLDTREGGAAA